MRKYSYYDQNDSKSMYEIFGNDPRYANRIPKVNSPLDYSSSKNGSLSSNRDNSLLKTNYLSSNKGFSSYKTDYSLSNGEYSSPRNDYSLSNRDNSSLKTDYLSSSSNYSREGDYSLRNYGNSPRNTSSHGIKGIRNICNTCFINSVLQVLMNLPQFIDDIINSLDKISPKSDSSSFIKEICKIFYQYSTSRNEYLQINKFYDVLQEKIPFLGDGSQHDAAEFFQLLAESCESEIVPYISSSSRSNHNGKMLLSKAQMLLNDPFMKNFGLSMITSVVCGNCENVITEEVQTNFILHLPLVSQTLEGCIARLFDKEPIQVSSSAKKSDYNPYQYRRYDYDSRYRRTASQESSSSSYCCNQCRNKSSFNLCSSIYRIPRFLFIQVARFDSSLTKNSASINAPEQIDLQQYINEKYFAGPENIRIRNRNDINIESLYSLNSVSCSLYSYGKTSTRGGRSQSLDERPPITEDENLKRRPPYPKASYHLVAVILHDGSFSAGHYTAAINSQGSSRGWTIISDDIVLDNSSFRSSSPYCFIYQIDQ